MTESFSSLFYSRKEGIARGVLVDVTEVAKEIGFKVPVVFTRRAYSWCVSATAEIRGRDETSWLRDVLRVLAFNTHRVTGNSLQFRVFIGETFISYVRLDCLCGPDDDGKPCFTIYLSKEEQLVLDEALQKMKIALGVIPR